MHELIAKKAFDFNGRRLVAGDRLQEPSDRKARLLVRIGRAEFASSDDQGAAVSEAPVKKRKYKTRALTAEN